MVRLTEGALTGFKGPITPFVISGPTTLYRFSGHPSGRGEWWISEDTFLLIYNEARDNTQSAQTRTSGTEFRRLYRKYMAVSIDWNDLQKFFRMDVPQGATTTGWSGQVKEQPLVSAKEQKRLGRSIAGRLGGGLEQLFVEEYDIQWVRPISL